MSYKYYVFSSCSTRGTIGRGSGLDIKGDLYASNKLNEIDGEIVLQSSVYNKRYNTMCTVWTVRKKKNFMDEE